MALGSLVFKIVGVFLILFIISIFIFQRKLKKTPSADPNGIVLKLDVQFDYDHVKGIIKSDNRQILLPSKDFLEKFEVQVNNKKYQLKKQWKACKAIFLKK